MDISSILAKHAEWLAGKADGVRANLTEANLTDADLPVTNISPEGRFTAWKLVDNNLILQIYIPPDVSRVNAVGSRKCRAAAAMPVALFTKDRVPVEGII